MASDAVYFADRIVVPYHPRLVVLYSGGNDINAGRTPERVFADYQAFVAKVQAALPDTRILDMGIGPSPKRWAQAEKERRANQLIHDYVNAHSADGKLEYLEAWDEFLDEDGDPRPELFVADKLHNNPDGYKIRVDLLKPHVTLNVRTTSMSSPPAPTIHASAAR